MAYKQKSSPLNKGVTDAETMNAPIDNRMGNVTGRSFMSKHSIWKSALPYGSPLHVEKTKAEIKKDKQDERSADKLTNQEKRATNQTNRQSNRAENKTKRQGDRATAKEKFKGEAAAAKTATDATRISDKAGRVEKRQVGEDYRKAKSDIKTGERQEWSDRDVDSDSGLSSYKVKGKVKLDRKAIKKQAGDEATKKAAKRAKK